MAIVIVNGKLLHLPPSERLVEAKITRSRGYASWKPRADALALVDAVNAVLAEYAAYLPLTARQIFYRMVATEILAKNEREYERLLRGLNRGRRAGLIDFGAIRDDGITRNDPFGFDDADEIVNDVLAFIEHGVLHAHLFQPVRQYVLCEAAGMVPQVARIAHDFGASVISCGGFDSLTAKRELARELAEAGKPVLLWSIGDHDPSGQHLFQSAAEDVEALAGDTGHQISFQRLAVTQAQIDEHDLPEAPIKGTDARTFNGTGTVQAEALPPDVLARILRDTLSQWFDVDAAQEAAEASAAARLEVLETLKARLA